MYVFAMIWSIVKIILTTHFASVMYGLKTIRMMNKAAVRSQGMLEAMPKDSGYPTEELRKSLPIKNE
jgi:hypothetical protein